MSRRRAAPILTEPVAVDLTGTVLDEVRAAASAATPRETGGLLLGWWDEDGVVIRHAIEVPDKRASRVAWLRRPTSVKRAWEQALVELDHPLLGYVGDWHSHPEVCDASGRDQLSIAETSNQYERPIVLLVHRPDDTTDVRVAHRGTLLPRDLTKGSGQ
jgi:proteasome lid subunit RPN8/RPN11